MPKVYLSLGSNIDRVKHLSLGLQELHRAFGHLALSPVYQSQAVGFRGDDFFNMVVGVNSEESIESIVVTLKQIEKLAGRNHSAPKFSARTLDIDLLNYGDGISSQPIVLPREEILYNAFVLAPLNDIAEEWVHPVVGQSIAQMWQNFDRDKQPLTRIESPFDPLNYR